MEKKKVGFASGVGFILAAAGSAVGLGNLWGFPYKTSQNGGAAFVLIYIACVLLIGFVTMLSEIYLGRRAQANPMTAYKMIHKNLGWCGLVAIVIPAFIICYYSVLGGWTTKYALNSFSGNAGIVGTFSVNTGEVILYTAIFLVLSMMIIMGGVKDGIEKASKVLMPVLFLILVAIAVYALTLGSGVREGLSFYLKPDFSGITFKSVLVAMGQAFYSLSLGMGIMITYGSYTGKEVNLVRSTAMICIFDTLVALIAGLAIFPSVAHFDPALLGSSKGAGVRVHGRRGSGRVVRLFRHGRYRRHHLRRVADRGRDAVRHPEIPRPPQARRAHRRGRLLSRVDPDRHLARPCRHPRGIQPRAVRARLADVL